MKKIISLIGVALLATGCASISAPITVPEVFVIPQSTMELRIPTAPLNIGIYSCVDTSGQKRKPLPGTSDFSSAVPQDCVPFLMGAVQSLPKHYRIFERSNIESVLKERQLATIMLDEKSRDSIGKLGIADIVLFGQIVSYDRTATQSAGGVGISAIGVSRQMVSDTLTFSIRAVSTRSGQVLREVTVRKTVQSIQQNGHILRIIGTNMGSLEYGGASNEPAGLALKQAVELAVQTLTSQGLNDGWW